MAAFRRESAADAVTLGNALAGFLAMTYVADGRFTAAALLILLAVLLDGLDGFVARRFGRRDDWRGRVADAFADAISFSLAPALFLYALLYDPARGTAWSDLPNALAVVVSTLVAALGLIRLLRFAEADYAGPHFLGLPTPANAMFLVSLALLFGPTVGGVRWNLVAEAPGVVLAGALVSSALMVTEIPYPKIGEGLRVLAAAGSAIAVGVTLPTVLLGGLGAGCTLGPAGCPAIELPLFAAAFGLMVAYIVGGPRYVHVGSRQKVVSVQ